MLQAPGSCVVCRSILAGRQRRFCSRECKKRDTNVRLQNYAAQQRRGSERKRAMMLGRGTQCARCHYGRSSGALTWHHRVPAEKRFDLDLRAFSNRSMHELAAEAAKCDLSCANCHAEVHHPDAALEPANTGEA